MTAKDIISAVAYFLILSGTFYCAFEDIKNKFVRALCAVGVFLLINAAIVYIVARAALF